MWQFPLCEIYMGHNFKWIHYVYSVHSNPCLSLNHTWLFHTQLSKDNDIPCALGLFSFQNRISSRSPRGKLNVTFTRAACQFQYNGSTGNYQIKDGTSLWLYVLMPNSWGYIWNHIISMCYFCRQRVKCKNNPVLSADCITERSEG